MREGLRGLLRTHDWAVVDFTDDHRVFKGWFGLHG